MPAIGVSLSTSFLLLLEWNLSMNSLFFLNNRATQYMLRKTKEIAWWCLFLTVLHATLSFRLIRIYILIKKQKKNLYKIKWIKPPLIWWVFFFVLEKMICIWSLLGPKKILPSGILFRHRIEFIYLIIYFQDCFWKPEWVNYSWSELWIAKEINLSGSSPIFYFLFLILHTKRRTNQK